MTPTISQPAHAREEFSAPSAVAAARRAFRRRWLRVAWLAGTAHQLDMLAKITIAASIAYTIATLTISLRAMGWGWWAGALTLMAGGLAWVMIRTRHRQHRMRRLVVVLGSAILIASLGAGAAWWAGIICAIGAVGAIYQRPRGLQIAERLDAMQHWPSTTSVAVSLMRKSPAFAHPIAKGFEQQLYLRAGEGLAAITTTALLRPGDVGRQWARAWLFLIAAVVCGFALPAGESAISGHARQPAISSHQRSAGAGFVAGYRQKALPARTATAPHKDSARSSGRTTAGHGHHASDRTHTTGKLATTARHLRDNIITARHMLTQLKALAARQALDVTLGRHAAAQLNRELHTLKPLGAGRAMVRAIEHELKASGKGRAKPLIGKLQEQIQNLLRHNLAQLQTLRLPTGGSRRGKSAGKGDSQTNSTGHQPPAEAIGQQKQNMSRTEPRTRHANHLIPNDHLASGAEHAVPHAATGVRIYTFDVPPKMAGGTGGRSVWRDAARALAPETGYIPHRYRADIRHYFNGIPPVR